MTSALEIQVIVQLRVDEIASNTWGFFELLCSSWSSSLASMLTEEKQAMNRRLAYGTMKATLRRWLKFGESHTSPGSSNGYFRPKSRASRAREDESTRRMFRLKKITLTLTVCCTLLKRSEAI
jgi:hypothetical protein